MADNPHAPLDDRLREAFEADPRAVSRVAREALTAHATGRRRGWLAAVSAAAIVCLAAAIAWWPPGPAPRVEPAGAVLVGSVTDGLVVVPLPDGSMAITGGVSRRERPEGRATASCSSKEDSDETHVVRVVLLACSIVTWASRRAVAQDAAAEKVTVDLNGVARHSTHSRPSPTLSASR